ncbi:hypothetical protein J6590_035096 [Homalodisca vitripennis]|nr:hypothetical protein J6590_035096 [Homalodisca vitripennis]
MSEKNAQSATWVSLSLSVKDCTAPRCLLQPGGLTPHPSVYGYYLSPHPSTPSHTPRQATTMEIAYPPKVVPDYLVLHPTFCPVNQITCSSRPSRFHVKFTEISNIRSNSLLTRYGALWDRFWDRFSSPCGYPLLSLLSLRGFGSGFA